MTKTSLSQLELLNNLQTKSPSTELPLWLAEGVYQYLRLSAEEMHQKLLLARASFAVKKRIWTSAQLDATMPHITHNESPIQSFVAWAVDFLKDQVESRNLFYSLRRKWEKFVQSGEYCQTWPVEYLLKQAFYQS